MIYLIIFSLWVRLQTLTMRNGFGLPPFYSQEQEMQRGMGYNEGYRMANASEGFVTFSQNEGFSMRREYGMPNHIGMPSLTNMMKPDPSFGSELANENQYGFNNHSTSMKVTMMYINLFHTIKIYFDPKIARLD